MFNRWRSIAVVLLLGSFLQADDGRSFLSLQQKGDLIWRGHVDDRLGRRYEMYVVPGYVPPATSAVRGWSDGADHLLDYFRPEPYRRIGEAWKNSGARYKDVFVERMGHYTTQAWSTNFAMAADERARGAFGWYLSYPYAFGKSVLYSAFNLTWGTVEAVGITAGLGLWPVLELASPPVQAAWHIGIRGTAWPALRMGWNTVVTPPLSLLEFEPTPSSADGFWVREITASSTAGITHAQSWHPDLRGKNPNE
jgi:hypothetical protein